MSIKVKYPENVPKKFIYLTKLWIILEKISEMDVEKAGLRDWEVSSFFYNVIINTG
jgi:hypothetical protein